MTDEQGNVQEVTYTYAPPDSEAARSGYQSQSQNLPAHGRQTGDVKVKVDPSFNYYDNARGKINNELLSKLIDKYDADNTTDNKQIRLDRWTLVTDEYCQITGQTKNRTALMKRWSSAKYYK